jgi:spore maturation protein CgeB
MKVVVFCQSLISDWAQGAAHALRGLVAELQGGGHAVDVYEPEDGWSRRNLLASEGQAAAVAFATRFPTLRSRRYRPGEPNLDRALAGADAVLVDEWTDPALVAALGAHRTSRGAYRLLFHDGHHRALADRPGWDALELGGYDAVLVGSRGLSDLYGRRADVRRVQPWLGAADLRVVERRDRGIGFSAPEVSDLVWIGDHREHDENVITDLLLAPVRHLDLRATVYGVRFPARARAAFERAGADFRGYLPDHALPAALSRARLALHLPRALRGDARAGVPESPLFALLACGVPVVSAAPSADDPTFEPQRDLLQARTGHEVAMAVSSLLADPARARALGQQGRATVLSRHTCAHRVAELLALLPTLDVRVAA